MRRGFKSEAERLSARARRLVGLPEIAPLPARVLAEAMRVKVVGPLDIPGLPKSVATQLLFEFEKNWSGVMIPVGGGNVLVHNTNHLPERQESNIMHELAHLICRHKPARVDPPGRFPWASRSYDPEQEDQASWLGACLQIPRSALVEVVKQPLDNLAIAKFFGSSVEMVSFRRNMTGLNPKPLDLVGRKNLKPDPVRSNGGRRESRHLERSLILQPELF